VTWVGFVGGGGACTLPVTDLGRLARTVLSPGKSGPLILSTLALGWSVLTQFPPSVSHWSGTTALPSLSPVRNGVAGSALARGWGGLHGCSAGCAGESGATSPSATLVLQLRVRAGTPTARRNACADRCRKEIGFKFFWVSFSPHVWVGDIVHFLFGRLRVQIEEIGWEQAVSATGDDGVSCLTFRVV
jgi:hypothetical protein